MGIPALPGSNLKEKGALDHAGQNRSLLHNTSRLHPLSGATGTRATGTLRQQCSPELHIPAGTWITVRTNETISSNRNQPGEYFTSTLVQPIVANGFVIARRGQILEGIIAVAEKSGRLKGTSRLGLKITNISLVDGQHVPVLTQLIEYVADPSQGADAVAIATTTGIAVRRSERRLMAAVAPESVRWPGRRRAPLACSQPAARLSRSTRNPI
jgi:hypothetical protein